MAETVLIALIVAVIPSIASLIVGLKNSHKLVEIHMLTNSNLTKVTSDLALANERIEKLEALIMSNMEKERS